MLQWEHSAILSTFIKLPFDIKIFVLSIFERLLKAGFTVHCLGHPLNVIQPIESSYTTHRIKLHFTNIIMCMYLPSLGGGGALFFV